MPLFWTNYSLPGGAVTVTSCYARDVEHLHELMAQRGLGETLSGDNRFYRDAPVMPSDFLRRGHVVEALHSVIWVAMIAVKAGLADAWELLNDRGIIHELSHAALSYRGGNMIYVDSDFVHAVTKFERGVPGVHPCWGKTETASTRALADCADPPEWRAVPVTFGVDFAEAVIAATKSFTEAIQAPGDKGFFERPPADPNSRGFFIKALEQGKSARAAMIRKALEKAVSGNLAITARRKPVAEVVA